VIVWKGNIADDDASTVSCFAYVSFSKATLPSDESAIRDRFKIWPVNVDLLPVAASEHLDGAPRLHDGNSFELLVTFCPVDLLDVTKTQGDSIAAKVRARSADTTYFAFYPWLGGLCHATLRFDPKSDSFKMRLSKEDPSSKLPATLIRLKVKLTVSDNPWASNEAYVLGVMTSRINMETSGKNLLPSFAIVEAEVRHVCFACFTRRFNVYSSRAF
jgi:hypothetical protein